MRRLFICVAMMTFALVFMGQISTASAIPPVDPGMSNVVAFDISKGQQTDRVTGFIADLQAAGFTVATVDITTGIPDNVMKIIVLGYTAAGEPLPSPYTAAEGAMLANWVSNGGELMINGEHTYFVPYFTELMQAFGITPQNNGVLDETDSDWARIPYPSEYHKSWVYYQSDNFASHPILAGVTEVQFLAGCSLNAPSGVIITTDADATPSNVPVAVALQWGSGRVAMFGDSSWLMDVPGGYDRVNNAKLAMQTISWLNEEVPPPPVASFTEDKDAVSVGETIAFDASGSYDPDGGSIVSYDWDFGDGNTASGVSVTHQYGAKGTYTVTLRVTDDEGQTGTATAIKTVSEVGPGVPEFGLTMPVVTSVAAMIYLAIRKRIGRKLE